MSDPDSITPRLKTCTKCGGEYPDTLEFFYADPGTTSGRKRQCKQCVIEVQRLYRLAHSAKIAARQRAYQLARPPKRIAWAEAHRGAVREYQRAYRRAHCEEASEYGRKWRGNNRDKVCVYERNHEARKLGNGGTHTAEDIQAQYGRQKGRCFYCDAKVGKKYHVDHVTPLVKKGSNGPENLVIACPTCNLSKGAKHPQEFCGRLL